MATTLRGLARIAAHRNSSKIQGDSVSIYRAATCQISAVYRILGGLCKAMIVEGEARYEEND